MSKVRQLRQTAATSITVVNCLKLCIAMPPGDGSGGDSIYKGEFNDEKGGLKLKHDAAGAALPASFPA